MSDESITVGTEGCGLVFDRPFTHDGHVESVRMRIVGGGLRAERRVDVSGLPGFLAALAEEWRGWDGARLFRADYYDSPRVTLSCTHDRVGHVYAVVELGELDGLRPAPDWAVRAEIVIEPGGLRDAAEGLSRLLGQPLATA